MDGLGILKMGNTWESPGQPELVKDLSILEGLWHTTGLTEDFKDVGEGLS